MRTSDLVILILTITICSVIFAVIATAIVYPERVIDSTRTNVMDLSKFILGIIAGYLGGKHVNNNKG